VALQQSRRSRGWTKSRSFRRTNLLTIASTSSSLVKPHDEHRIPLSAVTLLDRSRLLTGAGSDSPSQSQPPKSVASPLGIRERTFPRSKFKGKLVNVRQSGNRFLLLNTQRLSAFSTCRPGTRRETGGRIGHPPFLPR